MSKAQTQTASVELPFFASIGASAGELSTATAANTGLFLDGYKAGYHGSKKAHEAQRIAVREALVKKYNL